MRRVLRLTITLAWLALIVVLCSCAMFNKTEINQKRTTTIGQELIDLEEAKEKGAISQEEYEKVKERIISQNLGPTIIKLKNP